MQERPPIALYLETRSESKKHPGKYHIKIRITFLVSTSAGDIWKQEYVLTNQFVVPSDFILIKSGDAKGALRDVQDKVNSVKFKVL